MQVHASRDLRLTATPPLFVMCSLPRFEALAKNSQCYFEKCTRRDPQFQAAEALFTEQTSRRRPSVAVAANYAAVTYDTLSVRTRHYCTWERRMRSFNSYLGLGYSYRARERAVARVARDIIGPRDTGVHRVVFFLSLIHI
eukprot:TRINITY_DN7004_c1_g1_i2.p1 TRINITY_DN7004_c1_g1~~TRINITY_DN7004_c1_g1_i2.p1  ORF type:complete len:141 (-),score=25.27 TRINITY_DN7004_c1_g1_i2:39-461(-)